MSDSIFLTDGNGVLTGLVDTSYAGELVIPEYIGSERITSIGERAFYNCTNLTSVTIPNSVTSIVQAAFVHCTNLTSIAVPNSVTSIGEAAFYNCSSLTFITIPDSITSIGKQVFKDCHGLTSITIPNSITSIGDYAFDGCSGLTSVTIPDSVTSIGEAAFVHCGLTSITIPNSITNFGMGVFSYCYDLTSVIIQDGITSVGDYAFEYCSSLTSVIIPDSVTSIGEAAFYNCTNLTSITIPDSVTSIGDNAFNHCMGLTSIVIPDNVTNIGSYAFSYCYGLTSIYVQNPKELSLAVSSYDWSETYSNITFKLDPRYDTSYLIKNSTLISIADKIRVLDGSTESMSPAAMTSALETHNIEMTQVLSDQDSLIAQIVAALEGKTGNSGNDIETCTITCSWEIGAPLMSVVTTIIDDNGNITWEGLSFNQYLGSSGTINNVLKNSPIIATGGNSLEYGFNSNLKVLADPMDVSNPIDSNLTIFKADDGYISLIMTPAGS